MAALIPPRLSHLLSRREGRLLLFLGADAMASIIHEQGERRETLASLDLAPTRLAEAREILKAIRTRLGTATAEIALRLPADAALRTEMTLPLAAQANLAQVVGFELDRRTPFKSEEVYWTHRLLKRDSAGQGLTIEITVVPRTIVDDTLALVRGLGIDPDAVEAMAAPPAADVSGNLLPARRKPLAARLPRLVLGALAGIALLLLGAALLIPLFQAHQTGKTLAIEMAAAKRQAEESSRLQQEIDAVVRESGFLGTRKRETPSISELLQALTSAVPDDTWLTELHISRNAVSLAGFSSSASTLLGLLDQSSPFANATFRSPVTQIPATGREQFDIGLRVARPGGS